MKAKVELNQTKLGDKHIRVDTCGADLVKEAKDGERKERNHGGNSWEDFTRTIFIGNLPFIVSEEELRS